MRKICSYCCVNFSFSIIDDNRCSNLGLVNLCLHINNGIILLIVNSDNLLLHDVCLLKCSLKLGRKICWRQLERLDPSIAFFQENIRKLLLHIKTDVCKIFEEHWCLEHSCLVVKCIDSESYTWALIIFTISHIHCQKIFWVKLILKLSSEINHEAVHWSCFDWSSDSICISWKIKCLHGRWIFNKFMHETQVMKSWCEHNWTYLFCYRWIV